MTLIGSPGKRCARWPETCNSATRRHAHEEPKAQSRNRIAVGALPIFFYLKKKNFTRRMARRIIAMASRAAQRIIAYRLSKIGRLKLCEGRNSVHIA